MNDDFSELLDLARDLGEVPEKTIHNVRQAVEHAAFESKKAWKPEAKVSGPARTFSTSIDYDMKLNTSGEIGAEVGPNLERTGGGWGLLDEGGPGVFSAPQHGSRVAAKVAETDLEKGIEIAVRDIL